MGTTTTQTRLAFARDAVRSSVGQASWQPSSSRARIRLGFHAACPWSKGVPAAGTINGLPPLDAGIARALQPGQYARYYLLDNAGHTLAIEINQIGAAAKVDGAYARFVRTFRFD